MKTVPFPRLSAVPGQIAEEALVRRLLADDPEARAEAARWLAECDAYRAWADGPTGPHGPCRKAIGHSGRCRNTFGISWEGCCNADQHPRHATTQPTLDLGAAS